MGWFRSLLQLDPITYALGGEKFADNMENGGLLYATNRALKDVDPAGELIADNVGRALGYNDSLGFVRGWGEPVGNAAGAIFAGGVPIGSLVMAADDYSRGKNMTGHLMNAGMSYLGSQALSGLGSTGSTSAWTDNGGLAATEATQGLSSTGGLEAGQVATDAGGSVSAAPSTFDASNFGAKNTMGNTSLLNSEYYTQAADPSVSTFGSSNFGSTNTFGQPVNEFGYQGLSGGNMDAAGNAQFMATPTSQFSAAAGVGGVGSGLESTAAEAAKNSQLARSIDYGKLGTGVGKMMMEQEQRAAQERQRQQMMMQRATPAPVDFGPSQARVQAFQNISPYAKFSGGFNTRPYGSNVRKQNYGLLG